MQRTDNRFIKPFIATLLCLLLWTAMAPKALAWKPRSHAHGVNSVLHDALDGHLCFPGLSEQQIPIGSQPLFGYYEEGSDTLRYNDLVHMGPYIRAGSIGPDAYPDIAFGQLAVHVDHSRKNLADTPFLFGEYFDELNPSGANETDTLGDSLPLVGQIIGEPLLYRTLLPLLRFNPARRSIDYGHEVMKEAGQLPWILVGRTRSEMLADPLLRGYLAQYEAKNAFAYGYFMHLAGDSFAHSWVNDIVEQPFSLFSGRRETYPYLDPGIGAGVAEELGHYAIERYLDTRFEPIDLNAACKPVDSPWIEKSTSLCDVSGGTEFPIDCAVCNPLREGKHPPDAPLPESCDQCFDTCNPWKEICPPVPTKLPCGECKELGPAIAQCESDAITCALTNANREQCQMQRADCISASETQCAEQSYAQCCDVLTEVLVNANVMTPDQVDRYTCQNDDIDDPFELLDKLMQERESLIDKLPENAREQYSRFAPNGCYQGPINTLPAPDKFSVDTPGGEIIVGADGQWGAEIDLNADGETDLLNECILINCLQSPGTCPLRALKRGLPETQLDRSLVCETFNRQEMLDNPAALFNTQSIDMPHSLYKEFFLERRYPESLPTGNLGTYSLGGYVPNSVYMITDIMEVSATALEAIRRPLLHVVEECALNDDPVTCELAAKIAAIEAALGAMVAIHVVLMADAAIMAFNFPPIGVPYLMMVTAQASIVTAAWLTVRQGAIPGMTLPLRAKQAELLDHLEEEWYPKIAQSAQALSGETCTQSCAGLFEQDSDCSQHRLLALQGYFDWAFEAYEIVDSLDCDDNNYLQFLPPWLFGGGQTPSLSQTADLIESGGTIIATQYLGCRVLDWYYTESLLPGAEEMVATAALDAVSETVCNSAAFYLNMVEDNEDLDITVPSTEPGTNALGEPAPSPWMRACTAAIEGAYGNVDDPSALLKGLRDFVAVLDEGGLSDEQKDTLFPLIENQVRAVSGIEIDMHALDALEDVTDCAVSATVVTDVLDAREVLVENLANLFGDEAADLAERIDRAVGNAQTIIQDGFDRINPAPGNIEKFFPMYNTLQLNKTIIMGDDTDDCERQLHACMRKESIGVCAAEAKVCVANAPVTGLRAMAVAGNAKTPREAFAGAYSNDTIDVSADGFRKAFFTEQFFDGTSWRGCENTNWNVMCNSVYSMDDPDDYCRTLDRWDQVAYENRSSAVQFDRDLNGVVNDQDRIIEECAPALKRIDETQAATTNGPYKPDARQWFNPADELRVQGKTFPASGRLSVHSPSGLTAEIPEHRRGFGQRSLVLEKVIPQDFARNIPVSLEDRARETQASYYPFNTARFSLANKDEHVTRLYANVFAPFYCPAAGEKQNDWDCDAIPDECDNCAQTYNPDQRDLDHNGIGDDCPKFNPVTAKSPKSERWSLCHSDTPILVWDSIEQRYVHQNIVGQPGSKRKIRNWWSNFDFNLEKYRPKVIPPTIKEIPKRFPRQPQINVPDTIRPPQNIRPPNNT